MPGNAGSVLPVEDGPAGQFRTIVADDGFRLAIKSYDPIQFAGDPMARDRCVSHQCQTLAGIVVDHIQGAEPT